VPRLDTGVPSKRIESRGWRPAIGKNESLGWHAGKSIDRELRRAISDGIRFTEPYASALVACGHSPFDPWDRDYIERTLLSAEDKRQKALAPLPLGALLGTVRLHKILTGTRVLELHRDRQLDDLEIALGHYDEADGERFGWVIASTTLFERPIPMRGFQQLWEIPREFSHTW
jgi:hypothetical protein